MKMCKVFFVFLPLFFAEAFAEEEVTRPMGSEISHWQVLQTQQEQELPKNPLLRAYQYVQTNTEPVGITFGLVMGSFIGCILMLRYARRVYEDT